MAGIKGIEFVYIFVGAFIGLLFAEPISDLAAGAVANTSGMAATLYGYIGVFYALCCLGMMIGSLAMFFKSRR